MIWKSLLGIVRQFLWLAPLFALWAFSTGIGNRRFAKNLGDDRIEFAPGWIQFGAWAVMIIYLAYWAADAFRHHHGKFLNLFAGASLTLMALLFLFVFPGTIVVASDGLRQVYWFSRSKLIRWDEIVEINTGKNHRTVTITGANRTKIIHSSQLPDRARLLLELKRYCGGNLPPNFPRETNYSQN